MYLISTRGLQRTAFAAVDADINATCSGALKGKQTKKGCGGVTVWFSLPGKRRLGR